MTDDSWEGEWESAVSMLRERYIIEMSVPWSQIGGMPGRPLDQWRRIQSLINRLEELFERVKRLETNRKEEA